MALGMVKWFDVRRGYGYIVREAGEDVFVHYSQIIEVTEGRHMLAKGEIVVFEIGTGPKGRPHAINVTRRK